MESDLITACKEGRWARVREILGDSSLQAACTRAGCASAFAEACAHGHVEIVEELLSLPVSKLNVNDAERFPFYQACRSGQLDVVRKLLALSGEREIKVHYPGNHPFQHACARGHVAVVRELLALDDHRAIDIHSDNDAGFKAACTHGHIGVVRELLALDKNRGIPIKTAGLSGFQLACQFGHVDVVLQLLSQFGRRWGSSEAAALEGILLGKRHPPVMHALLQATRGHALTSSSAAVDVLTAIHPPLTKCSELRAVLDWMSTERLSRLGGVIAAQLQGVTTWNKTNRAAIAGNIAAELPVLSPVRVFLVQADRKRAGKAAQNTLWRGSSPKRHMGAPLPRPSMALAVRHGRRWVVLHRARARVAAGGGAAAVSTA